MREQTRVVHVTDNVEGAVYIGRANTRGARAASPFANPFISGTTWGTRAAVVAHYRQYLLTGLRGKPLACWCRHDGEARTPRTVCHGDVLVELLEQYSDAELRALATGAVARLAPR